jgi:acyl-CoA thioesterase-1
MKILGKLKARANDAYNNPAVLIACLGDSVTHGCFEVFINRSGNIDTVYRPGDGYVSKLQRRLNEYYPAAAVSMLNAGVSGDSAAGGLARLERDVLSHNPDLVTVNFALNDAMGGLEKLPAYEKAMDSIMERVLGSGAECLLITPNRMCDFVQPSLKHALLIKIAEDAANIQNGGVLDAYVNAARAVAKRRGVPVADANAVWNRLHEMGADTTAMLVNDINHPSPAAHDIFVQEIIRRMLDMD